MSIIGDVLGRPVTFEELSPDEFRREAPVGARQAVDMLLAAWDAAIGRPAYVTPTVSDMLGRLREHSASGPPTMPPRSPSIPR